MDVCWLEQNNSDVPLGDWWLSEGERARQDWLHIPKRRGDWRLGRWTAKYAVSVYLNLARNQPALAAVELWPGPSGAPEVFLHGRAAPVQLSLSHSHRVGLCAITRSGAMVGCDLETVEHRSPAFLADYFTSEEQKLVAGTPLAGRDQVLTLLWSIKESVLKALHCGLRADTREVNAAADVVQSPAAEWCPVSAAHISGRILRGWWRVSHDLIRTIIADPTPERIVAIQPGAGFRL